MGSSCITPLFLAEVSGQPRSLYPREKNPAMVKRLGGPQSQPGRYLEEKNLFSLPGIET
jgi:hypothetical protein